MKFKTLALSLAVLALPAFAASTEDSIRTFFESKLGVKVEQISKTPIAGIYEVVAEGQFFYTDEKANYLIAGNLVEARTMKNLTAERKADLAEKKLSKLPYENAIKHVRGNGKNVLVTFEDPNCGYCKRLWNEVKQLKDVTVYTFMIPILSEDSMDKAKTIWCSADRNRSWSEWMMSNTMPVAVPGAKCEAAPVLERNLKLSQSIGVRGTPFLYFPASKQQVGGFISAAEIEKAFAKSGG